MKHIALVAALSLSSAADAQNRIYHVELSRAQKQVIRNAAQAVVYACGGEAELSAAVKSLVSVKSAGGSKLEVTFLWQEAYYETQLAAFVYDVSTDKILAKNCAPRI